MKRILMLSYEYPPLGGGTGNALAYILKEYCKQKDIKADLITSSANKSRRENLSENITIYYLDIFKNGKNLSYQSYFSLIIYSLKALFQAYKLKLENKYDLVHSFYGIPCAFVAMLLFKPYIVSLRGSDVPFYNKRFNFLDKYFLVHLNKLVWGRANRVVANSEDLKKLALKTLPNIDVQIIPNGVDTNFFKPDKRIKKEKAVLFVGRLIPRKRADLLISAFARLPENIKNNWIVWIVGEGPEKMNLVSLAKKLKIAKQVRFLGHLNKEKLKKIYQQASIYVLPSENEGMSNTLLEAMASGLPVITRQVGDGGYLVTQNGILINNKVELTNAMSLQISSKKTRNQMGCDSRKVALKLQWFRVADNYLRYYEQTQ